MREILFKAKRIDNDDWAFGSLITYADETRQIVMQTSEGVFFINVDPETVCQYTGLEDMNGEKIFEGDIVDLICAYSFISEMAIEPYEKATGVIIWDLCGWCAETNFDNGDHRYIQFPEFYAKTDAYIIGNIHDKEEGEANESLYSAR